MTLDPVVLALRAAIAAKDSVELRVALGNHLLGKAQPAAALAEYEAALGLDPAHRDALARAADAAEAAQDAGRAAAYRLALGALTGALPPAPVVAAGPRLAPPPPASTDEAEDDDDDAPPRLRVVRTEEMEGLEVEQPTLTFADVAGMDEVKAALHRSFLLPLQNPEMYRKFGKRIGGGLVLYGAPGCGKTFLARALAGEIGARFVNVALSDVLDMWYGESERKLHELFESARRRAPTVLFFDEVDALGQRRTQLKGAAGRTLVNQLLSEMDGFAGKSDEVFLLAATNHPWDLDPALRRPGRFDRLVFVPPPDAPARKKTLELKLAGKPVAAGLDLTAAARSAEGYSGADLQAVVERATEYAIEASVAKGGEQPIDETGLRRALREVKPSTRPWFETARNYVLYANEGGLYDELLGHLKKMGLA